MNAAFSSVRRTLAPTRPEVGNEYRIAVAFQQDQFIADVGCARFEHAVIPSLIAAIGNVPPRGAKR